MNASPQTVSVFPWEKNVKNFVHVLPLAQINTLAVPACLVNALRNPNAFVCNILGNVTQMFVNHVILT